MRAVDEPRFCQLMAALAATFGVTADAALLEGYWLGLERFDLVAVESAIRAAISKCTYMPRPAELRELAGEVPSATRAKHAWEDLCRAIGAHGRYASVDFEDPLINATVRNLGGWQRLCNLPSDEFEKWTRKDFEKTYAEFAQSGITAEQGQYLVGHTEHQNGALGYGVPEPVRVGTRLALPVKRLDTPKLRAVAGEAEVMPRKAEALTLRLVEALSADGATGTAA